MSPGFTPPSMNWDADDLPTEFAAFKQYCELIFDGPYSNKSLKEKASFILIWIGRQGIETFNSFEWIDETDKKKPNAIFEKFESFLAPKVNKWMARLKLQEIKQEPKETVDDFIKRCKLQATKCKFTTQADITDRLTEQLIYGVHHVKVRERILEKGDDLDLNGAIDIARTYEATQDHLKKLTSSLEVDTISSATKQCYNCGGSHDRDRENCPAYGHECHYCHIRNHFAQQCRMKLRDQSKSSRGRSKFHTDDTSRQQNNRNRSKSRTSKDHRRNHPHRNQSSHNKERKRFHTVDAHEYVSDKFDSLSFESVSINTLNTDNNEIFIQLNIQRVKAGKDLLKTKLDTGAQGNILPLRVYKLMYPKNIDPSSGRPKPGILKPPTTRLTAYGGTVINQYGNFDIDCDYNGKSITATFHVTDPEGPVILGYPAIQQLELIKFHSINQQANNPHTLLQNKTDMIEQYPTVFDGIGKFAGQYHITLDRNTPPVIHPPRRVAYRLKDEIKGELDRMVEEHIIIPVREGEPTAWVNSLVYRRKPSGQLRICLDPKDLNNAICRDHHVIPTLTELLPKLSGAKYFSIVDAKCGYWNVELDTESSYLTTFNSPHGRYRFLRMPFGLKMSQDVFQSKIDQTFEGCPGVIGIADDIVIFGATEQEHSDNLHQMIQRCQQTGLKLNPDKCHIKEPKIKFYGIICSEAGIQPDPDKVAAIKHMKEPTNTKEVQTFLGMATYMGSFIPKLSQLTSPLRDLIKKNTVFDWTASYKNAFEEIKRAISEQTTLKYFNTSLPVTLQVDASLKGVGATLLQDEKPIAFASKALTETESRYANIERELLAVVYGCEKFHTYLFGQNFTVETDHKPLESIHLKHLVAAPPRLQRMLLRLQPYDLQIIYKPGKHIPIADALSRLSPHEQGAIEGMDVQIHSILPNFSSDMLQTIQVATSQDDELNVLKEIIFHGWPHLIKDVPHIIKSYWTFRDELSIDGGIILKGQRIIIPKQLQGIILTKLHEAHQGLEKTKLRARTSVYWRNINTDIDEITKGCDICQTYQPTQQKEPLMPSDIPPRPWHTVATDLFHLNGSEYLLLSDYYSKFPFVRKLPKGNSSSQMVTDMTKQIFGEHGIPKIVRSDNGPQYDGKAFKDFANEYGFLHITSSPLYPRSNGYIESQVKLVKKTLTKSLETNTDPNIALLCLRSTPFSNSIPSPSELLYGRQLQDNLPRKLTQGDDEIRESFQRRQDLQRLYYDKTTKELPDLLPGQRIRIQNQRTKNWEPGIIQKQVPNLPRSYTVTTSNDNSLRRNRSMIQESITPTKSVRFNLENTPTSQANDLQGYITRSGRTIRKPNRMDI